MSADATAVREAVRVVLQLADDAGYAGAVGSLAGALGLEGTEDARTIADALLASRPQAETPQEAVAWGVVYRGKIVAVSLHKGYHYTVPLYTRPTERTVTDAMVEAAVQAVRQYTRDTLFIDEHRELVRTALKAAMEAGRHD